MGVAQHRCLPKLPLHFARPDACRPFKGMEVRVVGDDGADVEPGSAAVGEVWCRRVSRGVSFLTACDIAVQWAIKRCIMDTSLVPRQPCALVFCSPQPHIVLLLAGAPPCSAATAATSAPRRRLCARRVVPDRRPGVPRRAGLPDHRRPPHRHGAVHSVATMPC